MNAAVRPSPGGVDRPASSGCVRHTVAVLLDHMDLFGGGCEVGMRTALEELGNEFDLNLLLVYGRPLAHPDRSHAAHNGIYELIDSHGVDGLVTLSPALSTFTGPAGLARLFERSKIAARCSAGVAVPGTPSIVIDNVSGMTALLRHLIVDHGHRRVAFIGGIPGNPDAEARLAAYRAVLAEAGLPFDSRLIRFGDFMRRSGELAMLDLLASDAVPDAVVAANDGMALGAMAALERYGYRLPEDVAVTGFDDLSMGRLNDPPLTTVTQPLDTMIALAVRTVVAQLRGESVEPLVQLSAQAVVRESCGCGSPRLRPRKFHEPSRQAPLEFLLEHQARILQHLHDHDPLRPAAAQADARRMVLGLSRYLSDPETSLSALARDVLREIGPDNERRQALLVNIGLLRDALKPILSPELEDQFHDLRAQIALTDTRIQVQQRLEIDQAYSILMQRGEHFSNSLHFDGLRDGLERSLPELGMFTTSMFLHRADDPSLFEPLVSLVDGLALPEPQPAFPVELLFRGGIPSASHRRTLLVFPLVLGTRFLGAAAFEYLPGNNGYVVVRDRVNVAIGSVELHQRIVYNTTLHERKIQEQQRLANEERIRGLNVLAGGVAHDLNNALGPLVALPDVLLEELRELTGDSGASAGSLRSDLECIKAAALRASQIIKDLLTMSRQNRLTREPLELNDCLRRFLAELASQAAWQPDQFAVVLDLDCSPLWLLASETHLQRAVSNLVHNAVDATEGRGQLRVRTFQHVVGHDEALAESVREGSYATLEIADDGRGIAEPDFARIFEPFFSSKPMNARSGSGLGLAIVQGVVKSHGGFIRLRSAPDAGTCFTLYFPSAAAPQRPKALSQPASIRGMGRILVVDDDPIALRTATRVLQHFGYAVDAESSGARARARFSMDQPPDAGTRSPYDLLILDMQLNEAEDGVQLYRRILERFPQQKAILSSGHAAPEAGSGNTPPGLGWLPKPYTAAALADAVGTALKRRKASVNERPPASRPKPTGT
jgi:DNA-binding LacI/PurR family transcriptional regulator/nitrogen-specific signal transduction histidine kinase/CheY-like chemotaxis protein